MVCLDGGATHGQNIASGTLACSAACRSTRTDSAGAAFCPSPQRRGVSELGSTQHESE